ncbi:MAG: DMT family transporter [Bacteroidales bacterium]
MTDNRKIWHWVIMALLSLIWGTSYILMKRGLESFSYIQVGTLRILFSFLCLLPIALKNLHKLSRQNFLSIGIIGLFGSGIPAFLFPVAQTRISSSLAGMLNSLSPVFTLVVGILFYKRHAVKAQITGVFLGLIGAVGLLYSGSFSLNYYGIFVVIATILYGISANEVSRVEGINGLQITSLAFLLISPIAIGYLIFSDFSQVPATDHWVRNLGCIALLAVMGSAIALALFYFLIRETSPVFGSLVTYFIPIVSTLWGLADNERFTSSMLISVAVILAGVYIINRTAIKNILRT